jgi:hypothetical protein
MTPLYLLIKVFPKFDSLTTSVLDPDADWIQIQSGQWIRIQIRIWNPDPNPGGLK